MVELSVDCFCSTVILPPENAMRYCPVATKNSIVKSTARNAPRMSRSVCFDNKRPVFAYRVRHDSANVLRRVVAHKAEVHSEAEEKMK